MTIQPKHILRERSFQFSIGIIRFVSSLPKSVVFDVVGRQLLRSATSIGANIIEAQAAGTKRDFSNYYTIALKSTNETIYWLELMAASTGYKADEIKKFLQEAIELGRMLGASIITLKGKRKF